MTVLWSYGEPYPVFRHISQHRRRDHVHRILVFWQRLCHRPPVLLVLSGDQLAQIRRRPHFVFVQVRDKCRIYYGAVLVGNIRVCYDVAQSRRPDREVRQIRREQKEVYPVRDIGPADLCQNREGRIVDNRAALRVVEPLEVPPPARTAGRRSPDLCRILSRPTRGRPRKHSPVCNNHPSSFWV